MNTDKYRYENKNLCLLIVICNLNYLLITKENLRALLLCFFAGNISLFPAKAQRSKENLRFLHFPQIASRHFNRFFDSQKS